MIDAFVDNLGAIQQHVISIKNEEGYYYGELFLLGFKKIVYTIDKHTRRIKQNRRSLFQRLES